MATEPDTALTKSEGAGKSPGRTPLGVWLLVLVLGGLAFYAGYMALHHRQLHADSEMVRKALASENDRLEASVVSLKEKLKTSKEAHAFSKASAEASRADAQAASAKIGELESTVAKALAGAKESAEKNLNAQSALKAAEEAKAKLMSENSSLKSQIAEAQKKLDAAVSDLTGAPPASTSSPSPLPEPSYP
jgi:chromosome segregation ATPase